MSKTEKNTLVPKLRFAESVGEWKNTHLAAVSTKVTDGTHDTPKPTDNGIPYLTAIHVKNGYIDYENCYFLPAEEHKKIYSRCNPEQGDLLMVNIGAGTANSALVEVNYEFSLKNVALVKPNRKIISPGFLAQTQVMNSPRLRHQSSSGGAQPFLSLNEIKKLKLSIPTLPEQKKIAAFLTAVDERIVQLKRKKTLLTSYKKGVMSRLFAAGGKNDECGMLNDECQHDETTQHLSLSIHHSLRFRQENGDPYPDWQEKKLGEVCKLNMGQSPSSSSYNNSKTGLPLIQGNADIKNRKSSPRIWTSEPTKTCQIGDLIITVRAPVGAIAISIHKACIGRGVASITSNKNTSQLFLYQFLLEYESKWGRIEQGSTFTAVSGSDIKGISIKLPTLPEQTKIANFLSNLDTKIEQITQTQTFKKGLLQQMFV